MDGNPNYFIVLIGTAALLASAFVIAILVVISSKRELAIRRKAEEALRDSEEKYRLLAENAQEGIYILSAEGFEYVNHAFEQTTGYKADELVLRDFDFMELIHPDDQEFIRARTRARQDGKDLPPQYDFRLIRKDEDIRFLEVNTVPLQAEPWRVMGILRDITKRKRAEEALRESEEQFRAIFEQAADSIVLVDADTGMLMEFNNMAHENLGYTREEFDKLKIPDFEVIESTEEIARHIEKIIKKGSDTFETKHRTKEGETRDVQVSSRAISHRGRNFVQSVWRDITERKQAEKDLRESEERFRQFFENAPAYCYMISPEGIILDVNTSALKTLGYKKEEIVGEPLNTIYAPEMLTKVKQLFTRWAETELLKNEEIVIITKGGDRHTVLLSTDVVRDSDGKAVHSISIQRDITERKRAEEEIIKLTQFQQSIIDNADVWLNVLDDQGDVLVWNKAAEKISGYSKEEVLGHKKIWEWSYPDEKYRKEIFGRYQEILSEGDVVESYETQIRCKNGENRIISWNSRNLLDGEGNPVGSIALGTDVTERKQAEAVVEESREQLQRLSIHLQSVREEERKDVAREIHDELGQALSALKMDLTWMKGQLGSGKRLLHDKIRAMTKLANTMIGMIKRLTSKLRPPVLDDLGVVAAIEWEVNEFQERYGIECKLAFEPKQIELNPDLSTAVYRIFQEVMTNVGRHARASMVHGNFKVSEDSLEIEIRDNGIGITKQQIADSSSFGLIGIHERVTQFGGVTSIKGQQGKGTTVTLKVPLEAGDYADD